MSNLPSHSLAFQSTLLQEERQQIRQTASDGKNFNPRSYKRSDARCIRSIWPKQIFQSTLLQEERQDLIFRSAVEFLFQSTLLQEERRGIFTQKTDRNLISIHAPTRGATSSSKVGYASENISIHAPTRGATLISASRLPYHLNFNPRSYKRSDDEIIRNQFIEDISIHAPTRGATLKVFTLRINTLFQSTLLQEERHTFHPHRAFHQDFNPRSYKRSDPTVPSEFTGGRNFNPRSYKRSDCRGGISSCVEWNFNPRSYKRSDLYHSLFLQLYLFQSTLLQEERQLQYGAEHLRITISIHAPTRGATLQVHCTFQNILISIHAPTRGATPRGSAS